MSSWQWDEVEYGCQSADPLERHNAHQAAKGRSPLPDPDVVRKAVRESAPACGKPMIGLYGAETTCARPKGPLHVCNPIWDWRDWESAPASQDAPEQTDE